VKFAHNLQRPVTYVRDNLGLAAGRCIGRTIEQRIRFQHRD
jgi:hypothetical protein